MFTLADIQQASLMICGSVAPDPHWHISPSLHDHHELIIVIEGMIAVAGTSQQILASTGDVLIYPAGEMHEEWSDPDHPLRSVYMTFTCPGMERMPLTQIAVRGDLIRELGTRAYTDRDAFHPAALLQRNCLLQAILAECIRSLCTEDQPIVRHVRKYIRQYIDEPLTLDRLAKVSGLSRFHFLRTYKQAAGRTPIEDVRAIRAEYARELVLGSNLPLKEIAIRAGFSDAYCLSRACRRHFGVPPGHYRRSIHSQEPHSRGSGGRSEPQP